jgi:hypothetical protein
MPPRVDTVLEVLGVGGVERREQAIALGAVVMLHQVLERRLPIEEREDRSAHFARVPAHGAGGNDERFDHTADLFVLTAIEHERKPRLRTELRVARQKARFFVLEMQKEQLAIGAEERAGESEVAFEQALGMKEEKLVELAVNAEESLRPRPHGLFVACFARAEKARGIPRAQAVRPSSRAHVLNLATGGGRV